MEKLQYEELTVPPDLADDLICIWTLCGDAISTADEADPIIPDGSPELIINLGVPFEQWENGQWVQQPKIFLHGQLTRIIRLRSTSEKEIIGVRFKPYGCAAFFGDHIERSTDRKVPLDELIPKFNENDLISQLRSDPFKSLIENLRVWRTYAGHADPQVKDLVEAIRLQHGSERIHLLKEHGDRSSRTIERAFLSTVGLRPKVFARIVRLRRIIQLMQEDPKASLAALAFDAGYYDQAHFNKEFRSFTGKSPREYFGQEHVLPEYFTGAYGSSLFSKTGDR